MPIFELPEEVDFIQPISVDINGLARGKVFPAKKFQDLLKGKEEMVGMVELVGCRNELPLSIGELSENHFCNTNVVLDQDTIQIAPWSDSLAIAFFDSYELDLYRPSPFNPRLLAKTKLEELESRGFRLLVGVENEFRLFWKASLEPCTEKIYSYEQFVQATLMLPFVRNLKRRLDKLAIEIDSWNFEDGQGQIEIALKPYFGLDSVDKEWLFREVAKHTADEMGMLASFMSVPLPEQSANGFHINHSLWREASNGELLNVLSPREGKNELSDIGKHWLAGILHHSRALCAIFCPTVNCYRRIRKAYFAPHNVSWNYRDRTVAVRVKVSTSICKLNYIENRIPTSACNIYIAVAALVVAGMDGIERKLDPIAPGNTSLCEELPKSLSEALEALKSDQVLIDGLGEKFVDWYIKAKLETDVNVLKNVDLDDDSEKSLKEEFEKYLYL